MNSQINIDMEINTPQGAFHAEYKIAQYGISYTEQKVGPYKIYNSSKVTCARSMAYIALENIDLSQLKLVVKNFTDAIIVNRDSVLNEYIPIEQLSYKLVPYLAPLGENTSEIQYDLEKLRAIESVEGSKTIFLTDGTYLIYNSSLDIYKKHL